VLVKRNCNCNRSISVIQESITEIEELVKADTKRQRYHVQDQGKREWFLNEGDLSSVKSETNGRFVKYSVLDLIQAGKQKHGSSLHVKSWLLERRKDSSIELYAAHLKHQIAQRPQEDIVQDAHKGIVFESRWPRPRPRCAWRKKAVSLGQGRVRKLQSMTFGSAPPLSDSTNGTGSPSKKAKALA
jgi:hypothetical protein